MKTTRPVFESFSDFVEYLALNEATATGPFWLGKNLQTEIFSKMGDLVLNFGTNFDTMKAEWMKNSEDCLTNVYANSGVGGETKNIFKEYFYANGGKEALTGNPASAFPVITDRLKEENRVVPKSYKTTVKSYEYLNAVGYKVQYDNVYVDSRVIIQYINVKNIKEFGTDFQGLLLEKPLSWDYMDKKYYDGKSTTSLPKDDAIYKMYWPNTRLYSSPEMGVKMLTSDGSQFLVENTGASKKASLAGQLTAKETRGQNDINAKKSFQSKPIFTKKMLFYTVPSMVLGGGNPYTGIETTTITVPTSETVTETKDYVDSIPLGESAIFAAGSAVPKAGMESTVLAAISKVFSQYTTIKSVTVQGSASWEWTDGKTRDDAKNIDLAKKRAEYFVTAINSKSGNKSLAKLSETPGVVQGTDKENEPKESWRKINLKINGTKSSTITVDKDIIEIKDNKVVLRYDKVTINEYCLSIELESPGIMNSKGWGYKSDEKDLKKIEKAKEKKEQWQLDEEAEEKKEKEKAENQTPTAGEKTPE
jgi:hypothetical protein